MRESSMKFFKEAFENISVNNGSENMTTLFMREKQKADQEKNARTTMQHNDNLLEEPVTMSGAPISFLKSRRMSARKKNQSGVDNMSNGSFRQTGNKFFAAGANPAST